MIILKIIIGKNKKEISRSNNNIIMYLDKGGGLNPDGEVLLLFLWLSEREADKHLHIDRRTIS